MPDAPVRNRRLIILAVIAIGVTALVGIRYTQRQADHRTRAEQSKTQGLEAYERGDYIVAANLLEPYVSKAGDDTETLMAYAQSCLNAPDPSGELYHKGRQALREVVRIDAENGDAAHQLIGMLYRHRPSEALKVAERQIKRDPGDQQARRARAQLLRELDRHAEALDAVTEFLKEQPLDLEMWIIAVQIRRESGQNPQLVLMDANQLRADHPDDPRSEMVMALAQDLIGDRNASLEHLRTAAAMQPPAHDPAYPRMLVRFHDVLGLYNQSMGLLKQLADPESQPELYDEYIHRLFERGMSEALLEALDKRDQTSPDEPTPVPFEAMRIITLASTDRLDQAKPMIDALAERPDGGAGEAWANLIKALHDGGGHDAVAIADLANQALKYHPSSGYLRLIIGDGEAAAGASTAAKPQWHNASLLRPSWALPRIRLSSHALSQSDPTNAATLAGEALVRQPESLQAAVLYILARGVNIDAQQPGLINDLLRYIAAVQEAQPGEPNTAVLEVKLHGLLGHDEEAVAKANGLLERDEPLPRDHLLRLIRISAEQGLGIDQQVRAEIVKHYGPSADLALIEAVALGNAGQPDAGLSLIREGAGETGGRDWGLAEARYIERYLPDQALSVWRVLTEQYIDDAGVQAAALRARSVWSDRQLMDDTINRLRESDKSRAQAWRLHRARYLLTDPDTEMQQPNAEDAAELLQPVVQIDPTNIEARLLNALALERKGQVDAAIEQITDARRIAPNDPNLLLQLGRLYQASGQAARSTEMIHLALGHSELTNAQRENAAMLLATTGDERGAAEVLMTLRDAEVLSPSGTLVLAQLLESTGQTEPLDEVVRVLAQSTAPESLLFAAQFYARGGEADQAEVLLTKLSAMDLPAGRRHALMAEHFIKTGENEAALAHLKKAAELEPTEPGRWKRLVAYRLDQRQPQQAIAEARQALRHIPEDPGLLSLVEREGMVIGAGTHGGYAALFETLIYDDEHRAAAAAAMDLMSLAKADAQDSAQVVESMVRLSRENPRFVALQLLTAEMLIQSGRPGEAAVLAGSVMQRFPNLSQPPAIAAQALLAAERYGEALAAATAWRQRITGSPIPAEVAISRAKLGLGDTRGALEGLAPFISTGLNNPDANRQMIVTYAQALAEVGRADEARAMLLPLAEKSKMWWFDYLAVGIHHTRRPEEAMSWLTDPAVTPAADDLEARMAQAQAIWSVAERFNSDALRKRARSMSESICENPEAPATAWFFLGIIDERGGDLPNAEAAYRKTLAINPGAEVATNNLAMVLANQGKDLDEAERLAQSIVDVHPDNPNLLDTLAYVQMKAGRFDEATATIQRAIKLEPTEPKWLERLAEIRAQRQPEQPGFEQPGAGAGVQGANGG